MVKNRPFNFVSRAGLHSAASILSYMMMMMMLCSNKSKKKLTDIEKISKSMYVDTLGDG
jgi:hypothetical protein